MVVVHGLVVSSAASPQICPAAMRIAAKSLMVLVLLGLSFKNVKMTYSVRNPMLLMAA